MDASHEHEWVAGLLFHLSEEEARLIEVYPDLILDTTTDAPRETVGPFCLECMASHGPSSG